AGEGVGLGGERHGPPRIAATIDASTRSPHNLRHDDATRSSPLVLVPPPGAAARPRLSETTERRPRGEEPRGFVLSEEARSAGTADPSGTRGVRRAPAGLAAGPGVDGAVLGRLHPRRCLSHRGEGRTGGPARERGTLRAVG